MMSFHPDQSPSTAPGLCRRVNTGITLTYRSTDTETAGWSCSPWNHHRLEPDEPPPIGTVPSILCAGILRESGLYGLSSLIDPVPPYFAFMFLFPLDSLGQIASRGSL